MACQGGYPNPLGAEGHALLGELATLAVALLRANDADRSLNLGPGSQVLDVLPLAIPRTIRARFGRNLSGIV
jgi:hypothetical protein